jgi:hypothetical protein
LERQAVSRAEVGWVTVDNLVTIIVALNNIEREKPVRPGRTRARDFPIKVSEVMMPIQREVDDRLAALASGTNTRNGVRPGSSSEGSEATKV